MNQKTTISLKNRTKNIKFLNLPFVIDENKIVSIVKNLLNQEIIENVVFEFFLPISFSNLKPGDVISLNSELKKQKLLIQEMVFYENYIQIYAINYFEEIYNLNSFSILFKNFNDSENSNFLSQIKKNSKTILYACQIPILSKEDYNFQGFTGFFVGPIEKNLNWKGASIFSFQPNISNSENFVNETRMIGVFGKIIKDSTKLNQKISSLKIDFASEIIVQLSLPEKQRLLSLNDEEFFSFKNLAKIGNEILCFKHVKEISSGIYKISSFLRGLFGSESFIDESKEGKDFFLLNENFIKDKTNGQFIGNEVFFKVISFGENISSFYETKIMLRNIYALQHTVCNIKILQKNNERSRFKITFEKRIRINDSVFVSDFEEKFETFSSVVFPDFQNPNQIKKINLNDENGFLIRIFENDSKSDLLFENVSENLFFEFENSRNLSSIYVEIANLNQIYINYYFISFEINLNELKISNIKYNRNF